MMIRGPVDVSGSSWETLTKWGCPENIQRKPPKLTSELLDRINKIILATLVPLESPTRLALQLSLLLVKKETPPVVEMRARMSRRKSVAQKGKNATRVEESSFELVLLDSLSLHKDLSLATQIGGALITQTDVDYLKDHTYLALYKEYCGHNVQLMTAMSLLFTAFVREKAEVIHERDTVLKLLVDEKSRSKTHKDKLQSKLETTEGALKAPLDTLRAHHDGKLLKKEVAKEIIDLTSYFYEEEESCGKDMATTTKVTNGTLLGESSTPDAEAKRRVVDEKDEAEDNE
ncbi:hypothetical protein TIFTF001_016856 [Ficus carica]|uniref:Uncharacterized protein n=1 Tax=Ficus carica TaxID=3494 RepID=A0AA88AK92_FICCA|nr:hypothetical protein TIFTF001_016856 [Ficus carica]